METVDTAQINSLPSHVMQADFVPPTDEAVFVLTSNQLKDIITQAVEKAIQPLQDEIAQDREEIATLRAEIASLKTTQEECAEFQARQLNAERRRISKLEHPTVEPGKTELSRAERIAKYLQNRPDHKATFEMLKGHLEVDKDLLGDAIKALMAASPERYRIIGVLGDKRKRALIMLQK
jgi:predicted RNase H-like nuclease (RuvC/YqgF family)